MRRVAVGLLVWLAHRVDPGYGRYVSPQTLDGRIGVLGGLKGVVRALVAVVLHEAVQRHAPQMRARRRGQLCKTPREPRSVDLGQQAERPARAGDVRPGKVSVPSIRPYGLPVTDGSGLHPELGGMPRL